MRNFKKILTQVAKENHTTTDNVLFEMQRAIDDAYDIHKPEVHALLECISHKGRLPTAEEVIEYLTLKVNQETTLAS